jgi:hypothetical protein
MLTAEEARELLDSIKVVRTTRRKDSPETDEPAIVGWHGRFLIGVMVYSFARINAVLQMNVRDYFVQGRRADGCGCTKKAERSTRFAVTTISNSTSMNISPPPALLETRTALCSGRRLARPARSPATPCGRRRPTE